jgi:hypothetical protein
VGQSISGGKLVLPISAAMIVTGVVIPYGDLADPGLAGSRRGMEDEQRQFIARGEQVCAVQYRRIRHRWFASNELDKMALAKETRWERYDRPRYLERRRDMVEVEVEDEMVLEGNRDKCTIGSEGVFFSATNIDLR